MEEAVIMSIISLRLKRQHFISFISCAPSSYIPLLTGHVFITIIDFDYGYRKRIEVCRSLLVNFSFFISITDNTKLIPSQPAHIGDVCNNSSHVSFE